MREYLDLFVSNRHLQKQEPLVCGEYAYFLRVGFRAWGNPLLRGMYSGDVYVEAKCAPGPYDPNEHQLRAVGFDWYKNADIAANYYFGFSGLKQVRSWLPSVSLERMHDHGYVCGIIRVQDCRTRQGAPSLAVSQHQAVFHRSYSELVGTVKLDVLNGLIYRRKFQ